MQRSVAFKAGAYTSQYWSVQLISGGVKCAQVQSAERISPTGLGFHRTSESSLWAASVDASVCSCLMELLQLQLIQQRKSLLRFQLTVSDGNMENLSPSASKEAPPTFLPPPSLQAADFTVVAGSNKLQEGWKRSSPLEARGAREGSHYVNDPKYQSVGCFQAELVDSRWVEKWNLLGVIRQDGRHGGQTRKWPPERCSPVSPPAEWFHAAVCCEWINRRRCGDESQQHLGANLLHRWALLTGCTLGGSQRTFLISHPEQQ